MHLNGSETLVLYRLEWIDQSVSVGSFVPKREPYWTSVCEHWANDSRIDLSSLYECGSLRAFGQSCDPRDV
jgi:hypothetical protein